MRTLIAGFGNVLRGDDGFGIEVLHRLGDLALGDGVELLEVGTAGIQLAQQLLDRYDRLIIIDAMRAHGPPGTLYVREVESIEEAREVDLHLAVPAKALSLAQALGALPGTVYLVGCEPVDVDELTTELSSAVLAAIPLAVQRVRELVSGGRAMSESEPGRQIERQDEILELLYWLEGEGFNDRSTFESMTRFLAQPEGEVRGALQTLIERGDVAPPDAAGEYHLTERGRGEAARRFAESFAPLLAQGHGECSDSNCDCHTNPEAAVECHTARARGGH